MAVIITTWLLSIGLVINALHISWVFRRYLELRRRVFELELDRDYPLSRGHRD